MKILVIFCCSLLIFKFNGVFGQTWKGEFQTRSSQILESTADVYKPPSMDIGDPEKYYWPKAIARFELYGSDDSLANSYIEAMKDNSPFHFTLVGMARMIYLYPNAPALAANRRLILEKVFERKDSHNPWTSEGTENHLSMARTSGYLFAQAARAYPEVFPDAAEKMQLMKEWARSWSSKIYSTGTGEWNSSIYTLYNLAGWLNLFDFAEDPEMRQMAKAVLDYYATEMALHYSFGLIGGSEKRGSGITKSALNATSFLAWLWFGEPDEYPYELKGSQFIQLVHAITSDYQPPKAVVDLAHKKEAEPAWYQNSKPAYLLDQPSFVKQFFYTGPGFTLGSSSSLYGGFTGSTYQIINWKMIAANQEPGPPVEISGNGVFWENFEGKTRDPWTQYFQHKNILFQVTSMPKNATELYRQVENLAVQWNERWKADFKKRYPKEDDGKQVYHKPEKVNFQNRGFLNIPAESKITRNDNMFRIKLDTAEVLVHATGRKVWEETSGSRRLIFAEARPGEICGFVLEVLPVSEAEKFESVKVKTEDRTISYLGSAGDQIEFIYNPEGTFQEATYDWGFGTTERQILPTADLFHQPDWPSGPGYGKLPEVVVNGQAFNWEASWPVFSGPDLELKDGLLQIRSGRLVYQVDYRGNMPIFSEYITKGID